MRQRKAKGVLLAVMISLIAWMIFFALLSTNDVLGQETQSSDESESHDHSRDHG